MKRFLNLTVLSVFFHCVVAPGHAAKSEEKFRLRLREDLGTLDWNYGEVNPEIVLQLMEGLFTSDALGKPVPAVVKSFRTSRDGLTWTFILKDWVWSDGVPLCAQHFKDSLERVLQPGHSPYAHYYFDMEGAQELNAGKVTTLNAVTVQGCHELRIKLKRKMAALPSLLGHHTCLPIRKDVLVKHPDIWKNGSELVVTGPYKLDEWVYNQRTRLSVNSSYPGSKPELKNIEFVFVPDDHTAVKLFETKAIDWMKDLPVHDQVRLSKSPFYKKFPSHIAYYLGVNKEAEPFQNDDLRRALIQALDVTRIPRFLHGGETPARGIFPEMFAGHTRVRGLSFQPQEARKALERSGVTKKKWTVTYYKKDTHVPLMEWIQAQWKEHLGLNVQLEQIEGKVYWSQVRLKKYPVFLSGITAFVNSPLPFLTEFLSDGHANWTGFRSERYDALVRATAEEGDTKKGRALALQAEQLLLLEGLVVIPLYFRPNTILLRGEFRQGAWLNPLNLFYLKNFKR